MGPSRKPAKGSSYKLSRNRQACRRTHQGFEGAWATRYETLVLWGGEFGRTAAVELDQSGDPGRGHNPNGYTMFLAGGEVTPGISYGQTDEDGYYAIKDKVHIHDLHATILHLMGLDHQQLTDRCPWKCRA